MKCLALILMFFSQLSWAQNTDIQNAREHLQAGLQAEKQQQYEQAIAEFRKVTELAPTQAAGFAKLGQVLMTVGRTGEAIAPLRKAVELDPSLLPIPRFLGYALLAQGFAEEAIAHFEKSQDRGALGIAQLEIGKAADAVANLQAALTERPDDPDLLFYLMRASEMLSSQTMNQLLSTHASSARTEQMLGQNFFSIGNYENALQKYQQALKLRPDLPEIYMELGQVYAASLQWAKAVEQFRVASERQPGNAQVAYRHGDALLQQGLVEEGLKELKRANELRPDMTETLYALGKASLSSGDEKAAEQAWLRVTELETTGDLAAQAHFNLAGLYRKQKKLDLANREMEAFRNLRAQETAANASLTGKH